LINKQYETPADAVADIFDGATVLIGGFGAAGSPIELIHALIDQGASDLVVVNNNTGSGHVGLAALIEQGRVAKMICSFPRTAGSTVFPDKYQAGEIDLELVPGLAALIEQGRVAKMICSFPRTAGSTVFPDKYQAGEIDLELVPQGTLAERIRAGGAGIPAFYTPTSVGTELAEGKETRIFGEREYVMEYGLTADFALIKCSQADRLGNLVYYKTARNFSPVMAMAAKTTIVQAGSENT